MSNITRHNGVVRSTGSRVFVVWRSLPDDPEHCLIIYRDSIPEVYNHAVTELVMGAGQNSIDLWEVMDKVGFLDRRKMLDVLHGYGYLRKQRTCDIDMHVGNGNKICLEELNSTIDAPTVHTDGKVKEFNPFNPQRDNDSVEKGTIVDKLIKEAEMLRIQAEETFERAYAIDPTRRPDAVVLPSDTVHVGEVVNTYPERRTFEIELPEGISQSKAIEMVKKALQARKVAK